MKIYLPVFAFIAFALVPTASAQWPDRGSLNVWGTATVSRQWYPDETPYLTSIRLANNGSFDRLVFEFVGGVPRFEVKYQARARALEMESGDHAKLNGVAFLTVNMQGLPFPEDGRYTDVAAPKLKSALPVVTGMVEIEWFEAVRVYTVGLKAKKTFRVTTLENPHRIVIDIKH
jgi:hypothetical protein